MKTNTATAAPPGDPPAEVLLHADSISLRHKGRRILSDISIQVRSGEIVGLLGPHGAGKSTLLSVLSGRIKPDAGSITLRGEDVTAEGKRKRQERGLAICVASRRAMLVEVAMAIVREPSVTCLDEPFDGISPTSPERSAIAAVIQSLRAEGLGVLLTGHDVRESLPLVDRAYLICEGQILRQGTPDFLLD